MPTYVSRKTKEAVKVNSPADHPNVHLWGDLAKLAVLDFGQNKANRAEWTDDQMVLLAGTRSSFALQPVQPGDYVEVQNDWVVIHAADKFDADWMPLSSPASLTKDAILKDASLESIIDAAAVVLGKMMHAEHCERSGVKPDHFSGFIAESWISKAKGMMNSMPKVS